MKIYNSSFVTKLILLKIRKFWGEGQTPSYCGGRLRAVAQTLPPASRTRKISKSSRNLKSSAIQLVSTSIDREFNSKKLKPTGLSL